MPAVAWLRPYTEGADSTSCDPCAPMSAYSSLEPKHPGLRLALRVAIVLLVLGSVAFAISKEAGQIGSIDWRFRPGWLALCIAALLLFQFLHIELWRLILRVLGGHIEARRARAIWSTTLLARYVP